MMMNEAGSLVLAWIAGGVLGALFFGGLWWTLRMGLASEHPAVWILGSLVVRMGVALTGFYFVADGDWQRLLACLLGFLVARLLVAGLTRPPLGKMIRRTGKVDHAPHAR